MWGGRGKGLGGSGQRMVGCCSSVGYTKLRGCARRGLGGSGIGLEGGWGDSGTTLGHRKTQARRTTRVSLLFLGCDSIIAYERLVVKR